MMRRLREATETKLQNVAEIIVWQFKVIYNGGETFTSMSFIKPFPHHGAGSDNSASKKSTRDHVSPIETGHPGTR